MHAVERFYCMSHLDPPLRERSQMMSTKRGVGLSKVDKEGGFFEKLMSTFAMI